MGWCGLFCAQWIMLLGLQPLKMKNKGFTLIEILVAMAVFMLISASTYAGFSQFKTQQALNVAYEALRNTLHETKSYAQSQVVKTTQCKASGMVLVGHEIEKVNGTSYYSIYEVCDIDSIPPFTRGKLKDVQFSPEITITTFTMRFNVITGNVVNPGTITVTQGSRNKSITVDGNGIIR